MTEMTTRDQQVQLKQLIESQAESMRTILPGHMTVKKMLAAVFGSIRKTPKLMECSSYSLINCMRMCAQLGLEPDNGLGHIYLIPRFDGRKRGMECSLVVGYKGLIELSRRTGLVRVIRAHVVRDNDDFTYELGLEPKLIHRPATTTESAIVSAYAVCTLKDGTHQFDVMSRSEIDDIKNASKAGRSGPWETHFAEMAKKTVLRRLCKMLPLSVEVSAAVALDEQQDAGIEQFISITPEEEDVAAFDQTTGEIQEQAPSQVTQNTSTPSPKLASPAAVVDPKQIKADLLGKIDEISDEEQLERWETMMMPIARQNMGQGDVADIQAMVSMKRDFLRSH